jgi:hypothetical protein
MFSTKVTIERFLKLIQGTDMVDPTLKKYMYLCGMVSQFIILSLYFLGRHVLSLYTRELIQFVKGMAHHQFIRDLVPSFLV